MLWTPKTGAVRIITNGAIVGDATPGTGVPSNATTLLDGAVTELISAASNTQDSWGIELFITATGASATASEAKLDILIGGATDDVLIPDICCGYAVTPHARCYFFPLHVPGGLRLAARLNSVRTSITSQVLVNLYGGGIPPFRVGRKVTTYGTPINGARGQAITPATSGGAATVTQMTASSDEDHFAFIPSFQPAADTTLTPVGVLNIGVGVGASTEQRIGTFRFGKDTAEVVTGPFPYIPCFAEVPAGSRLTILASNSGSNDGAYDGLLHAIS